MLVYLDKINSKLKLTYNQKMTMYQTKLQTYLGRKNTLQK